MAVIIDTNELFFFMPLPSKPYYYYKIINNEMTICSTFILLLSVSMKLIRWYKLKWPSPRKWNGSIHYIIVSPSPHEAWALLRHRSSSKLNALPKRHGEISISIPFPICSMLHAARRAPTASKYLMSLPYSVSKAEPSKSGDLFYRRRLWRSLIIVTF